jgi:hypothetical protein
MMMFKHIRKTKQAANGFVRGLATIHALSGNFKLQNRGLAPYAFPFEPIKRFCGIFDIFFMHLKLRQDISMVSRIETAVRETGDRLIFLYAETASKSFVIQISVFFLQFIRLASCCGHDRFPAA